MMHLLRSLFVGYFIAISVGTIAVINGYGALSVVLGVWLCGSVLSVVIAASMTPLEDADHDAVPFLADVARASGPMRHDLTARELARWDADLMAERLEADLAEDRAAMENSEDSGKREAG